MTDHRIAVAPGDSSSAPPSLVIVHDCAPGDEWTVDMVGSIMFHVPLPRLTSLQRGVAIVTTKLTFNEIRRHAFRAAWKDWVDNFNRDGNRLRVLVQDAHNKDLYCVFGPKGADAVIEVTVFDKYFFGLAEGALQLESCGQLLNRWDTFFTTIIPGCETTLTASSSMQDWLNYGISLSEQGPHRLEVVLLSGPHEVTYHVLYAPMAQAC